MEQGGGLEGTFKRLGEASLGAEEKRLYIDGKKKPRMDKDIQRWAGRLVSQTPLEWLCLIDKNMRWVGSDLFPIPCMHDSNSP